jgi:hypothetical protein
MGEQIRLSPVPLKTAHEAGPVFSECRLLAPHGSAISVPRDRYAGSVRESNLPGADSPTAYQEYRGRNTAVSSIANFPRSSIFTSRRQSTQPPVPGPWQDHHDL